MKLDFYDALQVELEKISKYDLTIIMGDFNAKLGQATLDMKESCERMVSIP